MLLIRVAKKLGSRQNLEFENLKKKPEVRTKKQKNHEKPRVINYFYMKSNEVSVKYENSIKKIK